MVKTQQMYFLSILPSLGVGKLKISDAFQKAHRMPLSVLHRVHLLPRINGEAPGAWKSQSDPCFVKRAVALSTQKSLPKSEGEGERENSSTLPPPKEPVQFLNYTWI